MTVRADYSFCMQPTKALTPTCHGGSWSLERWLPSPSSCWHLKFSKRSFLPAWRVHWLLSSDQPDADLVRPPPSTPRPSGNTRGALFDFLLIESSVLPLHEPCAGPQESHSRCQHSRQHRNSWALFQDVHDSTISRARKSEQCQCSWDREGKIHWYTSYKGFLEQ